MNKKFIHAATIIFTGVLAVVVLLHSLVFERGFHANWSISRYMGTDFWSAILFAVSNFVVMGFVLKYLLQVRKMHHLSIFWLFGVAVMLLAYLGVSLCPIGLFDAEWGNFGVVSNLHHVFSNALFISMAVIAVDTMIEMRRGKALIIYGIVMLAYAALCTYGYLGKGTEFYSIFGTNVFYFETGYILANLVFYGLIPKKR